MPIKQLNNTPRLLPKYHRHCLKSLTSYLITMIHCYLKKILKWVFNVFFREPNEYSSVSTYNELLQGDVEKILISLFSPNSALSYSLNDQKRQTNGEKTRGGYAEDGLDAKPKDYVSERTMDVLLRELRKTDRDRDRVLHPIQIKTLFSKYKVNST